MLALIVNYTVTNTDDSDINIELHSLWGCPRSKPGCLDRSHGYLYTNTIKNFAIIQTTS